MATSVVAIHQEQPRRVSKVEAFMAQVLTSTDREALRRALPAHVPFDRFERNLSNALMNEPRLLNCNPREVFREVAKIAALGLLIDSYLGEAYLIAASTGVQARIGYRGLIKLTRQSGDVSRVYAHEVCKGDVFRCRLGDSKELTHEPEMFGDRGDVIGFYAVIVMKDGETDFEAMSKSDVEKVRDKYSDGWKAFKAKKIKSTPWDTSFVEMGKKTCIRRLLKRSPQSPDLARAIRVDEDAEIDRRVALQAPDPNDGQEDHEIHDGGDPASENGNGHKAPNPDGDQSEWDPQAIVEDFETRCASAQTHDDIEELKDALSAIDVPLPAAAQTAIANAFDDAEKRLSAQAENSVDTPIRDATLDKLRAAATNGKRKLRLVQGGLTPAEREAVTNDDWIALNAAAEKVGQ